MKKLIALLALGAAMPAPAALVTLNFSGVMPNTNTYYASDYTAYLYLTDFQNSYMDNIRWSRGGVPGTQYSFTFTYDTQSLAVDGRFPVTFSEMWLEDGPGFADFTPSIFFRSAGAYTYMMVELRKTETDDKGRVYNSYAYFELGDTDGDIILGELPNVTDPSIYGPIIASFDVRGQGGAYRYWVDQNSRGLSVRPNPTTGAGAVPEPASWALLIAGFGLVGGVLRRRTAGTVVRFA